MGDHKWSNGRNGKWRRRQLQNRPSDRLKKGKRINSKKAKKVRAKKSIMRAISVKRTPLRMTTLKSARKEKLDLPPAPPDQSETGNEQHVTPLVQVLGSD